MKAGYSAKQTPPALRLMTRAHLHEQLWLKVGRDEGSCCRDMSQRHAAMTKILCSTH